MNIKNRTVDQLQKDLDKCLIHWTRKKQKNYTPYSYNKLADVATAITYELFKREVKFNEEDYTEHKKQLFDLIVKRLNDQGVNVLNKLTGLHEVEPLAKLIHKGMKTLIVKDVDLSKLINHKLVLLGDKAYGEIVLTRHTPITDEIFKELGRHHLVCDCVREEWWSNNPLYVYEFQYKPFDSPQDYVFKEKDNVIFKDVCISNESIKKHEDSLDDGDLSKLKFLSNEQLKIMSNNYYKKHNTVIDNYDYMQLLLTERQQSFEGTGTFTLHQMVWKGRKEQNYLPNYHWYLDMQLRSNKGQTWELRYNPLKAEPVVAFHLGEVDDKWLEYEGKVKPNEYFNPRKKAHADLEIIAKGTMDYKISRVDGKEQIALQMSETPFKGCWSLLQEEQVGKAYVLKREVEPTIKSTSVLQNQPDDGELIDMNKAYPNEHACRIREPGEFKPESFRRIKQSNLSIIIGRLKGKTTTTTQAYRYPKSLYSEERARSHCKDAGGRFEAALKKAEEHEVAGED